MAGPNNGREEEAIPLVETSHDNLSREELDKNIDELVGDSTDEHAGNRHVGKSEGEESPADERLDLPAPVTAPAQPAARRISLSAAMIVPIWMAVSASVILYNNYIYNTLLFKFPVFLVTVHLTFATIGTRILQRTTSLLDGTKDVNLTKDMFLRSILPIGLLFSGSLITGNKAYLFLSVAFIQMLKAFVPVSILIISFLFRIQEPNKRLALIVLMISGGVALASYGELKFDITGFFIQAASVVFESSRLVMIQVLLHNVKMNPLVSLHYYAPVCAAINLCILPFTEGLDPLREFYKVGPLVLLSNAFLAFFLNIAAVFLVGVGGGLVLTLAGVLKDIILIFGSVLIFGTPITEIQVLGYGIALAGLIVFKTTGGK
jgi:drug/metabolite transporter (DMT)-like permease